MMNNKHFSKMLISAICLMLLLCFGIGGTLAYLADKTESIKNTFTAAEVEDEVKESFDGTQKTSIIVGNTGDVEVYVRVKLISYRVDADDKTTVIGGTATVPYFTLQDDWFEYPADSDCYYYKSPVSAGESTTNLLDEGAIVLQKYTDADGGIQVIEVLTEAIQAVPKAAVINAWGSVVAGRLKNVETTTDSTDKETTADTTETIIN